MFDLEKAAYKSIETVFRLIGLIPRKWTFRLGNFLGHLLFMADGKHRDIVLSNLSRAFGHEKSPYEIKMLAKQVFTNSLQIVFDIGWSLRLDKEQLMKYFTIEGRSNIKNAYEQGRGVLVLTAHFGNWELLSVLGAMLNYPLSVVYRPLDFKPLERFFIHLRTRFGGKVVPNKRSLLALLRSLGRGEMVVLLMDQNVDWYEGVFVDFLGHRACTNSGLALLALKTRAPVVPVFMVREKEGFIANFLPEIPLQKTGDQTRDMEDNTQQYNHVIESFLRRYPDQWFWFHQRWKTRPYQPWPRN
uniref:Lysophospholipid acyltransferase family protein n=1 Tax=Candidatus Desulfatibia profunda TaxID=2841695 RepID=A0A8J6NX88_9BACT|nr:lysophospholipid acyltransferase family protein [Candidatus Desulfatibia profunda]